MSKITNLFCPGCGKVRGELTVYVIPADGRDHRTPETTDLSWGGFRGPDPPGRWYAKALRGG